MSMPWTYWSNVSIKSISLDTLGDQSRPFRVTWKEPTGKAGTVDLEYHSPLLHKLAYVHVAISHRIDLFNCSGYPNTNMKEKNWLQESLHK